MQLIQILRLLRRKLAAKFTLEFFNERQVAVLSLADQQLRSLCSFYVERTVPGSAVGSILPDTTLCPPVSPKRASVASPREAGLTGDKRKRPHQTHADTMGCRCSYLY